MRTAAAMVVVTAALVADGRLVMLLVRTILLEMR